MVNLKSLWLLTGGVVEDGAVRAAAGLVVGKHRHQVGEAALAGVGAVVVGAVAGRLMAVPSLDEGGVAVSVRHRVPPQGAVSFWRLRESQRLWRAGDWAHRTTHLLSVCLDP